MARVLSARQRIASGTVAASALAMAIILSSSLSASAWGNANYAEYHGRSQIQTTTYPFPFVLTYHDNINGTNYVSVQIRTNTGAQTAGPKVAGTGTVSYQAGTTYTDQVGGWHQGSSSMAGKFPS